MNAEPTLTGVAWLAILTLIPIVLGGIVLLVIGLSNRHTRGATIAVATVLGVLVVTMGAWLVMSNQRVRHVVERNRAEQEMFNAQFQHLESQAEHFEQLARNIERHGGEDAAQTAQQYRLQADELLHQIRSQQHMDTAPATVASGVSPVNLSIKMGAIVFVPLVLLFLFLLFKHAGPGVGLAAICLPLLLLGGVRYLTVMRPERLPDEAPATRFVPLLANEVAKNEISVDPLEVVVTSDPRDVEADDGTSTTPSPTTNVPDWVTRPSKRVGNVERIVVEAGPYDSASTCRDKVDPKIRNAVLQYVRELAKEQAQTHNPYVPPLENLGVTNRFIRDEVITEEYYSTRDFEHKSGMVTLHVLLEFDHDTTQQLLNRYRDYARRENVMAVSLGMGGVLASLAGMLGLIKLDTYTKGYYTKRLFIGVPAAIIGVVLLLNILA